MVNRISQWWNARRWKRDRQKMEYLLWRRGTAGQWTDVRNENDVFEVWR